MFGPSSTLSGSHAARKPLTHAVDLAKEDLPHDDASLEWWYVNGHLKDCAGHEYSVFAAFFRTAISERDGGKTRWGYALTWGIADVAQRQYISEGLVDSEAATIAMHRLDRGIGPSDTRLQKALREVMERGEVPLPDIKLSGQPTLGQQRLFVDMDNRVIESLGNDRYRLRLSHAEQAAGCDLVFQLQKPVVLHGNGGLITGSTLDEMFYYFCPSCSVEGHITVDGVRRDVADGKLWYDHEYGHGKDPDDKAWEARWNWLSTQLDNGWELTIYDVFDKDDGSQRDHVALLIDPEGGRHEYREFNLVPSRSWTSSRTFRRYPMQWDVQIPEAGVVLRAEAAFPDQEFVTYMTKTPFWEGRVEVTGSFHSDPVKGPGFVERASFGGIDSLEDFFAAVGQATRDSVEKLLPRVPDQADMTRITADARFPHYTSAIEAERFRTMLVDPIRKIVDRGGKAWRSYCLLACCDAVGGYSQAHLHWLALPELLHVGSLIVDDVQDESEVRRGGPACHVEYGVPLAINAGNLSYFLPYLAIRDLDLSDTERLRVYDEYFVAVRAAHVGQALDITGHRRLLERAAITGEGRELEEQVLATHRLKSGAPAAALARIGVILGHGTPAQSQTLGAYHENLGLAFQMVDDVLNLRGFENDLKDRAEDIKAGKVTLPIAKAMSRLHGNDRTRLSRAVVSRTQSETELQWAVDTLEEAGIFRDIEQEARSLVEGGWRAAAALLRPSIHSVHLRAFGSFVLDRHY